MHVLDKNNVDKLGDECRLITLWGLYFIIYLNIHCLILAIEYVCTHTRTAASFTSLQTTTIHVSSLEVTESALEFAVLERDNMPMCGIVQSCIDMKIIIKCQRSCPSCQWM